MNKKLSARSLAARRLSLPRLDMTRLDMTRLHMVRVTLHGLTLCTFALCVVTSCDLTVCAQDQAKPSADQPVAEAAPVQEAAPNNDERKNGEPKSGGFLDSILGSLFGSKAPSEGIEPAAAADPFGNAPMEEQEVVGDLKAMVEGESNAVNSRPKPAKRIDVVSDFEEAVKLSQLEQRPLLLIAGADWCSWCRKLEQELATPEADAILKKWVIAEIDVDDSPALAEEFEVSALPALRVLSVDRRVAAKQEGYMPLNELEAWLDEVAVEADPAATRVLYGEGTPDEEQLKQLVEYLGNRSPVMRQSAIRRLTDARAVAARPLINVMRQGRLAQKLSAIDVLRSWSAPVEGMDPWQPASLTVERLEKLDVWLENSPAPEVQPEIESAVDPEKIKDTVTRLLQAPESQRQAVLSELASYGRSSLPELRARLSSQELTDKQRYQLRQSLLFALASAKTRGQNMDLLIALADPNAEIHRQAAAKVLDLLSTADQPLLDELIRDTDPLVRELTVPVMQRLAILQKPERLEALLADKSPSVRTAVLREIAKHPDSQSLEHLSTYAARETDEDLLVYTAKTLGELIRDGAAEAALCQLMDNPSWRVRAAVLDAFGARASRHFSLQGEAVSKQVFESVLKATEDKDAFVVERALELIPKLIRSKNMGDAVPFLIQRPDQIERFWKQVAEHQQAEVSRALVGPALKYLDSDDISSASGAMELLSRISPDSLKRRLPTLMQSTDANMRIAALRATVSYLESLRKHQLSLLSQGHETMQQDVDRQPWYPVPESFVTIPDPPVAKPAEEQTKVEESASVEPAAPVPPELAAVDDFFGGNPNSPKSTESPAPANPAPDVSSLNLDLADSFFGEATKSSQPGEPVASQETKKPNESDESQVSTKPQAAKEPNVKLISLAKWLEKWFAEYEQETDDEVILNIRKQLRELLPVVSDLQVDPNASGPEQIESAWLALANLASGRAECANPLARSSLMTTLVQRAKYDIASVPIAVQILPWLPPDLMFDKIKDLQWNWQENLSEEQTALLQSITYFENTDVATWLLDQAGRGPLAKSNFKIAVAYLKRALRGDCDASSWPSIYDDALRGPGPFKDFPVVVAGTNRALEWLELQRQRELTDDQRALLMSQLFCFNFRLGLQSAVGCVAAADKWSREVEVATMIALADEPRAAADRAAQWLHHPVAEVRAIALHRLTRQSYEFYGEANELGVSIVNSNDSDENLFMLVNRPFPVEQLKAIADSKGDDSWSGYLLLLASGQADLNERVEGELDSDVMLTVVAALAKNKRNDEAAIKYYRRAADATPYFDRSRLQKYLKDVPGDEAKAIRKALQSNNGIPYGSAPF